MSVKAEYVGSRQARWDARYIDLARFVGAWSKDPSTKVGAVLVLPSNRVAATGYNGFPEGMPDDPHLYEDREYKYRHVTHAEENALDSLANPETARGCSLYTSFPVCEDCAALVIRAGIVRVVYPPIFIAEKIKAGWTRERAIDWMGDWAARAEKAALVLRAAGVKVEIHV